MSSAFISTQKYIDVLKLSFREYCRLLVFEGTVRSSKTEFAKPIFMYNVFDSSEELHVIAAQDLDAINDNILGGEHGLMAMFPNHLELRKDEIGGYYVHVKKVIPMNNPKEKKILLAGYSSASKWKKIVGKTFGAALVDETNTANKQFIDELFMRQVSANKPLQIWTLNGDNPDHWIYTDYINRARIFSRYRHEVPASIVADMDRVSTKETNWFYIHWNMRNNPIMTEEKISFTERIFKPGSHYHTIKVKGERGAPGKLIYIDYMEEDLFKLMPLNYYPKCSVGVDIGASRAFNSMTLSGFSKDFTSGGFLDKYSFKQLGYERKTEELIIQVKQWISMGANIEYVAVDSQEANYINDLKSKFKALGLPEVIPSYKATIKQRISLNIILFAGKRWHFNDTIAGRELYDSFKMCKYVDGKEGEEREDLNLKHNDEVDGAEYSQTAHMQRLLFAAKKYEQEAAS